MEYSSDYGKRVAQAYLRDGAPVLVGPLAIMRAGNHDRYGYNGREFDVNAASAAVVGAGRLLLQRMHTFAAEHDPAGFADYAAKVRGRTAVGTVVALRPLPFAPLPRHDDRGRTYLHATPFFAFDERAAVDSIGVRIDAVAAMPDEAEPVVIGEHRARVGSNLVALAERGEPYGTSDNVLAVSFAQQQMGAILDYLAGER